MVLERLSASPEPWAVVDTHAGAGLYDLASEAARRSGEAAAGVAALMREPALPVSLGRLADAVRACNTGGGLRLYPGSPWLASRALRACDRYTGCELRPDDAASLRRALEAEQRSGAQLKLLQADGFIEAEQALKEPGPTLLVVDPPYEQADDYARIGRLVAGRPRPARQPALIWAPLKDLETFDALLGRLEAGRPASLLVAQARLRALDDPMRMNGCAVVLVDAPDVAEDAREACAWVVDRLGTTDGVARVEQLAKTAT